MVAKAGVGLTRSGREMARYGKQQVMLQEPPHNYELLPDEETDGNYSLQYLAQSGGLLKNVVTSRERGHEAEPAGRNGLVQCKTELDEQRMQIAGMEQASANRRLGKPADSKKAQKKKNQKLRQEKMVLQFLQTAIFSKGPPSGKTTGSTAQPSMPKKKTEKRFGPSIVEKIVGVVLLVII